MLSVHCPKLQKLRKNYNLKQARYWIHVIQLSKAKLERVYSVARASPTHKGPLCDNELSTWRVHPFAVVFIFRMRFCTCLIILYVIFQRPSRLIFPAKRGSRAKRIWSLAPMFCFPYLETISKSGNIHIFFILTSHLYLERHPCWISFGNTYVRL